MSIPTAQLALTPPVGIGQGSAVGQPSAQPFPLSPSRLGYNPLGDLTALGLAQRLPQHLRVLQ